MEYLSLQPFENRKTNNGLKKLIDMRFKHHLLSLGCAALMLASCTDDALDNGAGNGLGPEADSNVVTLTVLDGASQQGRIHTPSAPDTRALKSQRLQYVATIGNPDWQDEGHVWSATSVYIDDDTQQAYITWHSDRQATNPAQTWGGAMDVINIADEDKPEMKTSLGNGNLLKFNNVMEYSSKLYLSAMHPRKGGVVARVDLTTPTQAELIGFPGSSVNAIALCNEKLMVVSGFKGTYGTVSPEQPAIDYDYEQPGKNTYVTLNQSLDKDFGGKYVAIDENGDAYILRQNGENNGQIIDVTNKKTIDMSVPLLSENKYAEDYDPETGEWITEGTRQSVYFGKHVMVIRKGYAYVAAGKSGIYKYDLTSGEETKINGIFATGLYADDEFLYAATGSGLRIYQFNDETGDLPLYAFEVETYDEDDTGEPTSTTAATTGANTKRHSPNFVAAHYNEANQSTYIYIAYGQSGVRVYKFVKEGEEQPEEPGDEHPWVDIDDPDIVWAEEDLEGYYAWGEIFHAASGNNTLYSFPADEVGLSFTTPDGNTTMANEAGYWTTGNGSNNKTAYTYDNYRYFTGSVSEDGEFVKFTKYSFDEGGKTVLDPEDDVATMRWGDGWRMPTKEEWERLLEKIDMEKSTETSEGLTLYFKDTEASLFFPPTGYYGNQTKGEWDEGGYWPGERAEIGFYYWSSTLCDQENSYQDANYDRHQYTGGYVYGKNVDRKWCKESLAWIPDFNYFEPNGYDRCFGMKVRPVKDKKNMPEFADQYK